MKIKVCGMTDPDNVRDVIQAGPDILGFIFYPSSKRFVGFSPDPLIFNMIPKNIKKTGVFVNEPTVNILDIARRFGLDYIQLHGSEDTLACSEIRSAGYKVIRAFGVGSTFDFNTVQPFMTSCNYFLFDTLSEKHGGSGAKFDWSVMDQYSFDKPFILSGGIGPSDESHILKLKHTSLYAIDINSRFEIEPGIKDAEKVKKFITTIKFMNQ
jgi:phosphoribosylanthranilate isomerase